MKGYLLRKADIDAFEGTPKTHFLNPDAQRINKSLGDHTGLNNIGFHLIEIAPGKYSTEFHRHYHEEECTYVLSGRGVVTIGTETAEISAGDFIGYRAGGEAPTMQCTGDQPLRCIVVGQRLDHDVGDYPNKNKRIYRQAKMPWNLVDLDSIETPVGGKK